MTCRQFLINNLTAMTRLFFEDPKYKIIQILINRRTNLEWWQVPMLTYTSWCRIFFCLSSIFILQTSVESQSSGTSNSSYIVFESDSIVPKDWVLQLDETDIPNILFDACLFSNVLSRICFTASWLFRVWGNTAVLSFNIPPISIYFITIFVSFSINNNINKSLEHR